MADNILYYGDNLEILRNEIKDETVDLVYLDPPFNSKATYNILFKSPTGKQSQAQVEAFEDTWHWGIEAEQAFDEVIQSGQTNTAEMLRAMRSFLGENDMMAYLCMMAIRLIELHRVLKNTGSIYLHCDPTASHYLKMLMDAVFGAGNFRNEIVWSYKRYTASAKRFQRFHDIVFLYSKTPSRAFNDLREGYGAKSGKADSHYKQDESGHWYRWQKRKGQEPYKIYLSEGRRLGDVWEIPHINASARERLGYPTQKPEVLLERIIKASSNEGDLVLDPFCGCGTTIHVAEKLKRQWIGIDITHLAISLIERRLNAAFRGIKFVVHGTPKDLEGARDLALRDKYEFQWWVTSLIGAQPYGGRRKAADSGIDGLLYFKSDAKTIERAIVSVKGGENVGVGMIRDLKGVLEREGALIGIFITLKEPTTPMIQEAAAAGFYTNDYGGRCPKIQILTIEELFDGKKPNIPLIIPNAVFKEAAEEYEDKQEDLPM